MCVAGSSSRSVLSPQVYLENPKQEEGVEDDPAIMTSHIIRAPPVLCAQVIVSDPRYSTRISIGSSVRC
jgi:hypothetical protein